jgi:hypothetical protein
MDGFPFQTALTLPDMTPADDDKTAFDPRRATGVGAVAPGGVERTALVPPPPAPRTEMGNGIAIGTRIAEFEITSLIGEGGFGIVYLAQDLSLGRRVALKEYMPSSLAARTADLQVQVKSERHRETFEAGRKSFVNEARLLASFDHPSLVKVYRFWEANGTAYMVMPFYEGKNLRDTLKAMGHAPGEEWLRKLLLPLTEALKVIHADQCYHRDIAPDNVMMLAGSQRPLLLDFGAARRVIGDMTQALTVILKPGYAPIEQYAEVPGMRQGPWTDVYALAAVVYSAITGKTPPVSVGRLMNDNFQPLSELAAGRYSPRFLAAVDRALAVRPEHRTPNIDAFCADLGLNEPIGAADVDVSLLGGEDPDATRIVPQRVGPPSAMGATPVRAPAPAPLAPQVGTQGGTRLAPPPPPQRMQPAMGAAGGMDAIADALDRQVRKPAPAPVPAPAPPPRRGMMLAGAGVALLAGVGGVGYWLSQRGAGPARGTTTPPPPEAGPAPVPAPPPPVAVAPAPPPVTPAPVSPPPPLQPFDALREFQRSVQAQTPGFAVQATAPKTQMRIGRDELRFTVTSPRDGYLYVVGVGPDGELAVLVPNKPSGPTVRVRKDQPWSFPAKGGLSLMASDPAGATHLLVLVSAQPRTFEAMSPKSAGDIRVLATGSAAGAAVAAFRGAGSVVAGTPQCAPSAACADEYGATILRVEAVK